MKYKGYIAVDFDRTICTKEGKWKHDEFGNPIWSVIKVIEMLYQEGYHINIFTGRKLTKKLKIWLKMHWVHYDTINSNKHNEKNSSFKPYYNCLIDDRSVNPFVFNILSMSIKDLYNQVILTVNRSKQEYLGE